MSNFLNHIISLTQGRYGENGSSSVLKIGMEQSEIAAQREVPDFPFYPQEFGPQFDAPAQVNPFPEAGSEHQDDVDLARDNLKRDGPQANHTLKDKTQNKAKFHGTEDDTNHARAPNADLTPSTHYREPMEPNLQNDDFDHENATPDSATDPKAGRHDLEQKENLMPRQQYPPQNHSIQPKQRHPEARKDENREENIVAPQSGPTSARKERTVQYPFSDFGQIEPSPQSKSSNVSPPTELRIENIDVHIEAQKSPDVVKKPTPRPSQLTLRNDARSALRLAGLKRW